MISTESNQWGSLQDLRNLVFRYYKLKAEYIWRAFSNGCIENENFEEEYVKRCPFGDLIIKYSYRGKNMQIPINEIKLAHETLDKMEDELRDMSGRKEKKWQIH